MEQNQIAGDNDIEMPDIADTSEKNAVAAAIQKKLSVPRRTKRNL